MNIELLQEVLSLIKVLGYAMLFLLILYIKLSRF